MQSLLFIYDDQIYDKYDDQIYDKYDDQYQLKMVWFGLVLIYDKPVWFGSKFSVNSLVSTIF